MNYVMTQNYIYNDKCSKTILIHSQKHSMAGHNIDTTQQGFEGYSGPFFFLPSLSFLFLCVSLWMNHCHLPVLPHTYNGTFWAHLSLQSPVQI